MTINRFYSVEDVYMGFLIVKVRVEYISLHPTIITHYKACKMVEGNRTPWKNGNNRIENSWGKTIDEVKGIIAEMVNGKVPVITDAEWNKYVFQYNKKHNYFLTRKMLLATMNAHRNGDAKMKQLMRDRLEDANYHTYCSDLYNNDYKAYMDRIEKYATK